MPVPRDAGTESCLDLKMKADDAMRVTPSSKLQWWWSGQRGKKIATRATAAVRIAHRQAPQIEGYGGLERARHHKAKALCRGGRCEG
jgi:hypothetical protein